MVCNHDVHAFTLQGCPICDMSEARQQGATDERRAIVEMLRTSYGVYLNEDMRVSADAIDRAIVMIEARGQQPSEEPKP